MIASCGLDRGSSERQIFGRHGCLASQKNPTPQWTRTVPGRTDGPKAAFPAGILGAATPRHDTVEPHRRCAEALLMPLAPAVA